ncbi:MAG TPA: formate transporter FocA [Terriglobia bacterium]|nr:formate transporter FocA [Terriglobia bacterium]
MNGPDTKFDALLPAEIAFRAEEIGVRKAGLDGGRTFVLAVLAGAFIALGAVFSTTVAAGTSAAPFGWSRALSGVAFSLGLILVIVGGAELFTGNNLIIMAWANGKVTTLRLLRNWAIVYAGNLAGSVGTAILVFWGGQYGLGNGAVGAAALAIGTVKCELGFSEAIALGVLCNGLVCLAVWLSYSGRTTADKILAVVPPIAAFVTAGFEHSVANMYFLPVALLIRKYAPDAFWANIGRGPEEFPALTVANVVFSNLVPVTLGNIIGGVLLVGATYWFVYLRGSRVS